MIEFELLRPIDGPQLLQLFQQLTTSEICFNARECTEDPNMVCVVLRKDTKIVGFGSLVIFRIPTKGLVGEIHDIIIDESLRSQGYGKKLMRFLLERAQARKLSSVSLTSKPARVAAQALYLSLGFIKKETDVFTITF